MSKGQDYWELIVSREIRELTTIDLVLSRTLLGWVLHGRTSSKVNSKTVFTVCEADIDKETKRDHDRHDFVLENMIKSYFDLDSLGINTTFQNTKVDKYAFKILESSSRRLQAGWEIGLLWKKDIPSIPASRTTALNRLFSLEKKLDKNPKYAELFYREMERLFQQGFVKKADENPVRYRTRYLPCFGVQNPNKPDKVRLVFDAATKSQGLSFNDLMLTGPDLLKSLLGVLMLFRQFLAAIK